MYLYDKCQLKLYKEIQYDSQAICSDKVSMCSQLQNSRNSNHSSLLQYTLEVKLFNTYIAFCVSKTFRVIKK